MTQILTNQNPPMVKWKEKMSLLMVTFIMVGVSMMFVPVIGYFNNKILFNDFSTALASIGIFLLGLVLTYLGLSSSFVTIYFKNQSLIIEKQIGILRFYKKYDLSDNSSLTIESEEDEDGITWYHLIQLNHNSKTYIIKNLDYQTYEAIQNFIQL